MKIVGMIGIVLLLAGCATRETVVVPEEPVEVVYFAFDFDTDQSAAPFADYGAAYIINVSDVTIAIPLTTWGDSTMFAHFYYNEYGTRPVFTEMMLARINRNDFLVLEPGDRVLAFSVAFFSGNLEEFPEALYDARIFVEGERVDIRGFVGR